MSQQLVDGMAAIGLALIIGGLIALLYITIRYRR